MYPPKRQAKKLSTSWSKVSGWYDQHLQKKDTYHELVVLPRLAALVKHFSNQYPAEGALSVLDLGCGQGAWVEYLQEEDFAANWEYTGIDISAALIRIATEKKLPQTKFQVEAAEKLPPHFSDSFDLVTCTLALQNMADLRPVFAEVSRTLRPGGAFIFVITHPAFRIPKHSDWVDDRRQNKIYRGTDAYMTPLRIPISSKPFKSELAGEETETTWTFHRPLQDYVRELGRADMAVVDLQEWTSHKKSEDMNPVAQLENHAREEIPMFMCVVARKLS
jgi:ubiquinone/menaquinone biosynthesis C-methylase UbiE